MSAGREPADLPVAIVTALPEELFPLLSRARGVRRVLPGRRGAWEGRLAAARVLFACTGDGAGNARDGLRAVLDRFRVSRWIGTGFAGALSPDLAPGTVLVARALRDESGRLLAPDSLDIDFAARALAAGGAVAATFVTARSLVSTAAAKADLRRIAGGEAEGPAAADLESTAWAASAPAGIPGVLVRVVSDGAGEELPDFLARCTGPGGGIDRRRVLASTIRRPWSVGKLLAMRRRARFSAERLADFLERFAASGF